MLHTTTIGVCDAPSPSTTQRNSKATYNLTTTTFKRFCGFRISTKSTIIWLFFNSMPKYIEAKHLNTNDKIKRRMLSQIVLPRPPPGRLIKNSKNVPDALIPIINVLGVGTCREDNTRFTEEHMLEHEPGWAGSEQYIKAWIQQREEWMLLKDNKIKRFKDNEYRENKKQDEQNLRQVFKSIYPKLDLSHLRGQSAPLK